MPQISHGLSLQDAWPVDASTTRQEKDYRRLQAQVQALEKENRQLRSREQLRQDLVSMLVHDLRVPMCVVLNSLELVNSDLDQGLNEAQREVLGCAARAGRQILNLVANLLELRALEADTLPVHLQPLDASDLVQTAITCVRPLADVKDVVLETCIAPVLPPVLADADLTPRIVINLLDNAIKYSPRGGRVRVTGQVTDSELIIAIVDEGLGIPPDQQWRVFERFFQVDEANDRDHASVGLGLAFCKLAVEGQRGRIWVESESGAGVQFKFTLPVWRQ